MKRNSAFLKLTLALCLAFTACGGDDGEQGPRGPGGATGPEGDVGSDGASALVTQTAVGPDEQCSSGGIRIDSGSDTNRDGTLDEEEITTTNVVCNSTRRFSLQLLHFADVDGNEAVALENVEQFSGLVDGFSKDPLFGPRTLIVSSGDNVIPGPRWFAAEDSSIRAITGSNEPGHVDHFFMNEFGVVASALGNHELDQGPGEFADSIASETFEFEDEDGEVVSVAFEGARFPYLAANVDFSQEGDLGVGDDGDDTLFLAGQVARSATVEIGAETVGLVGISTPALTSITSTGSLTVSGSITEIAELAAAVQPTVDGLVAAGVNKVVLLAHLQQIALEKALAQELRHVDIIVAGGSNTRMGNPGNTLFPGDAEFDEAYPFETTDADGNPIVIVNVDGDYKYLGRLVVDFDSNGLVIPSSIDPVISGAYAAVEEDVALSGGTPIEAVVELRDAIDIVIAEQFSNVVGHTDVFLEGRRGIVRTEETNLGNLTADSLKWYAQRCTDLTNVIALKNGGGIRAEIGNAVTVGTETTLEPPFNDGLEGVEPGDVSEGHFRGSLRFDNGAVVVSVTAAELKMILEHAVAQSEPGATPGQFPQVGGIWVGFDPAGTAQVLTVEVSEDDDRTVTGVATPGTRVTDLWVDTDADGMVDTALYTNGELLTDVEEAEDVRRYDLVTLNFLANGGDDAPFALLSDPMRRQLYEGIGFGDPDEGGDDVADFEMLMGCDPGLQNDFSDTGREQDILAEYFLEFFPDPDNAFNVPETAPIDDRRVQDLSIIGNFVEPMGPVAVAIP